MKTQFVEADEDNLKVGCVQTDSSLNKSDCQKQVQFVSGKLLKKRIGPFSFYLNDVIGQGFSSVVYYGIKDNDKNQPVALKAVVLDGMSSHRRLLLENQVKILKIISHPNLVRLIDVYYTSNNCYIILEYCEGGSLQTQIDAKISIDWPSVAHQIGSACQYLSFNRIMHRDIKPANVLRKGNLFKLADFGFAYQLKYIDEKIEQKYLIGSPLYMPPQSLIKNSYSLMSDSFAFGIFLFYISTLRFPWKGRDKQQLINQYQTKLPNLNSIRSFPPKMKHFINGLLQKDPNHRLPIWQLDLEIFSRVKFNLNVQDHFLRFSQKFQVQIKLCQFIHFLMINYQNWQRVNTFLMPMMSQHLGQLVEVFGWHKHIHMNLLKQKYILPLGLFQFTTDQYYWLNNCLKDTISTLSTAITQSSAQGILLKLLQYQKLVESLMYGQTQETLKLLDTITLHQTFDLIRPSNLQISNLLQRVDFYQL